MWFNNNPHIDHWTEASVGMNTSLIFLKDGKPDFLHPPPLQNEWLIEISAVCVEDSERGRFYVPPHLKPESGTP
jgi:hypothetical protein